LHPQIDCFYAQREELRDPSLRELPLGITQKYLVRRAQRPEMCTALFPLLTGRRRGRL
jgi:nucleotidyltransferase/DNA polymerase involved in DNA repair